MKAKVHRAFLTIEYLRWKRKKADITILNNSSAAILTITINGVLHTVQARQLFSPYFLIASALMITLLYTGTLKLAVADVQEMTGNNRYSTRYATIFFQSGEDLAEFTRNIATGFSFLTGDFRDPRLTAKRVDDLAIRVMKILGMRIPGLHVSLYLYPGQSDLDRAYASRVPGQGSSPPAYYDYSTNSIAVSVENVTDNILAHELVHAVVCAYFESAPPSTMQEILAEHVDRVLGEE